VVEAYHDRMPVILAKEAVDDWLNPNEPNPKALKRLLVPAADDLLQVRRVSRAVNLVANDYPELLEPVA
jgi:putative SOS response-associated peptidase YedK